MAVVRVVEMVADEIVDVVPVRDRLVPAVGAVGVGGVVAFAVVLRRAAVRVLSVDLEHVLVDVVPVRVVQVPFVEVVDMVAVLDGRMAAVGGVLVRMILVDGVFAHGIEFSTTTQAGFR